MAQKPDAAVIADKQATAAQNAEVIAKLNSQSLDSQQNVAADTIGALDELFAGKVKQKEEAAKLADKDEEGNATDEAAKAAADKKAADEVAAAEAAKSGQADAAKAAADKKAADEAAKSGQQNEPPAKTAEQTKAENDAAAVLKANQDAADAFFKDSPTLPPKASTKSSEAFQSVKIKAAQEISKLSAELEAHKKEVAALRAATKESLTPEVRAEIESLREFRAKLDIETDPRFKKFDADIKAGDDFIYAQLSKSPLFTAEVRAEIEKLGGPGKINMSAILSGINDPLTTRLVEGKLADLEVKSYEKQQAIKAAQSNVKGYLAERQKEWEQSTTSHNQHTKTELESLTKQLPWMTPLTTPPTATEAEKKVAADHNAFAEKTKAELELALNDDSPSMRATLLVGMAQLFRLQNTTVVLTAERDSLLKERDAANASLAKLKAASASRLRDGGGLPSGETKPTPAKESDQFTMNASDALDKIRAAKSAAQK